MLMSFTKIARILAHHTNDARNVGPIHQTANWLAYGTRAIHCNFSSICRDKWELNLVDLLISNLLDSPANSISEINRQSCSFYPSISIPRLFFGSLKSSILNSLFRCRSNSTISIIKQHLLNKYGQIKKDPSFNILK